MDEYSKGDNDSAGDGHEAVSGEHYTRQSVRWRESYVGGSAPMANATRQTTPPCMGCRSRKVRYNYPSNKDPLVSNLEYKTIEWGLKKGLPK